MEQQEVDVRKVISSLPGSNILVLPDSPVFTIVAVSDGYLRDTGRRREALVGNGLFEVFPNNPNDSHKTSEKTVRASLEYALLHKEEHHLPVQRYDIVDANGHYHERYWSAQNKPLLSDAGEVLYLVHNINDVTTQIKAEQHQERLKSIERAYDLFMQAPVAVCIVQGPDYVVELANEHMLRFLGRTEAMIGKPIIESLPEADVQGLTAILHQVRTTGETYHTFNFPATILIDGTRQPRYFDLVFKPYFQNVGDTEPASIFCVAHNVTKQIIYQKNMEESEHRFRMLIEEATVATGLYIGRELRIQYANDILLNYWGKDSSVIGMPLSEAVPELEGQPFLSLLDIVYLTGETYTGIEEEAFLHVDGKLQPFYFNFTYKALRDKEGKIYGIHHMTVDVTEQVRAKRKIEEAEQKARLAIESADLGTYEVNLATNKMITSPRFQKIWGIANTPDRNAYARVIHPDDLPQREKATQEAFVTGNLHYEARLMTGNASTKWVRVRGKVLFDAQHKPERMLGVVQDITEQKLFADELKKQVQEQTNELIEAHRSLVETNTYFQQIINKFVTALASLVPLYKGNRIIDFNFKMTNAAYSKYSGLSPEEIQNKRVGAVFPGYYSTDAFDRYIAVYQTGTPQTWDMHYNLDGLDVYLEVNASRMNDEVIVHLTDYSVLKNLQLNLIRKVEELERSNQNLKEFAYAASHDLKEPVRKIRFFGDRLRSELVEKLDANQVRLFERMEQASTRMGQLIDDLLEYSHVSTGLSHTEPIDLNKKVQRVLEDLELDIQEKKARIFVDYLPSITGNKRQVQQLFQNLIGNALKYRKPDVAPEIHITSRLVKGSDIDAHVVDVDAQKNFYLIEVRDNGIGFAQEDSKRIFNVFTRLHGITEYKGTGVGLSIARKVIENHGGYIWAESEAGAGATFKFLLPAQ